MFNMRKVIAVVVAGALAISGISVYADTASKTTTTTKAAIVKEQKSNPLETQLNSLVESGYLDSTVRDTVLTAAKSFKPEAPKTTDKQSATKTSGERPKGNPMLTALKEKSLISEADYNAVVAAMEKQHAAKEAEELAPLVKSGVFSSTSDASKAMEAYQKLIHEKMSADKPSDTVKEGTKTKPTAAEMKAMKEKMDAARTTAETEALASLVSSGDITQAQADGMKSYFADKASEREAKMKEEQATRETELATAAKTAGFADSAALQKAMETFHENMKAKLDSSVAKKEKGTQPTEAEMTAAKAAHDKVAAEVLSAMVTSGDITSAQADALKTLMSSGNMGFGGMGHGGPSHGGPEHGGPEGAPQE